MAMHFFIPGSGVADESVGSDQQMIGLLRTSRLSKVMHGASFC